MRLFVSTADASGDLHAAALVARLRERLRARGETLELLGLGGTELTAQGLVPCAPRSDFAIAGLVEILPSLPRLVKAYTSLRGALTAGGIDLALFVDSPDLNLPLASVARRAGLRTMYYVAPQVWAWRAGRVRKLRRRVDRAAVIFPFEEALLRRAGIDATFVGHPLVERMEPLRRALKAAEVARALGVPEGRPVLSLLPGSRRNELRHNLPVFVEAARQLREWHPELEVRLLLAPGLAAPEGLPSWLPLVSGRTHEAMAISTALIAAPGTVTIEAMLLGIPLAVAHVMNPITFAAGRRMVRVPSSAMVNLIAGRGVVPEFLQEQARPHAIAGRVSGWLRDGRALEGQREALAAVAATLGGPGASERAAALACELAGRS